MSVAAPTSAEAAPRAVTPPAPPTGTAGAAGKVEEDACEAPPAPRCPHIHTVNRGHMPDADDPRLAYQKIVDGCECGKPYLTWVCLTCLEVFCSRKASQYSHSCATLTCNIASTSVRCTKCNRTLDNDEINEHPVLMEVLKPIHQIKFGHHLMLKPRSRSGAVAVPGVEESLRASETIEEKWKEFQQKFQDLLNASIGAIGASLGATLDVDPGASLEPEERHAVLGGTPTLEAFAAGVKAGRFKNIMVVAGAGMSTSAGLPDFRSPDTGLYAEIARDKLLDKFELERPEDLFDIKFFRKNPLPFYSRARALYPGQFKPTRTHYLLRLLEKKGVLRRVYTQNIDGLETLAGLSADKLIQCHGGFSKAHCIECRAEVDTAVVRESIFAGRVLRCACDGCDGLVKPDIVFFGETLSSGFREHREVDVSSCDALIVIGTSLTVAPTAHLPKQVPATVPRVLINREAVGNFFFGEIAKHDVGLAGVRCENYRDVPVLGDCDDGATRLAEALGWGEELSRLHAEGDAHMERVIAAMPRPAPAPALGAGRAAAAV